MNISKVFGKKKTVFLSKLFRIISNENFLIQVILKKNLVLIHFFSKKKKKYQKKFLNVCHQTTEVLKNVYENLEKNFCLETKSHIAPDSSKLIISPIKND